MIQKPPSSTPLTQKDGRLMPGWAPFFDALARQGANSLDNTTVHNDLEGRDATGAHPTSAIDDHGAPLDTTLTSMQATDASNTAAAASAQATATVASTTANSALSQVTSLESGVSVLSSQVTNMDQRVTVLENASDTPDLSNVQQIGFDTTPDTVIGAEGQVQWDGATHRLTTNDGTINQSFAWEDETTKESRSTGLFTWTGVKLVKIDATHVGIGPGTGHIVDTAGDHTDVTWVGDANLLDAFVGSTSNTFFLINSTGAIIQQGTFPTPTQLRQYIYLGYSVHAPVGTISVVTADPAVAINEMSQVRDLLGALGLINRGILPSPNGANISINTSAGYLYNLGLGFATSTTDTARISVGAQNPATFQYRTQTGNATGNLTNLEVGFYDLAGVRTAISGTRFSTQRVYVSPAGIIRLGYGQALYNTMTAAVSGLATEVYTPYAPFTTNFALIGLITLKSSATSLLDSAQAIFHPVSIFGESVSAGAGVSVVTLQQAYDNGSEPEILTSTTRGALNIQRGSAADTDTVLQIQNGAGANTASITGAGVIAGSNLSGTNTGDETQATIKTKLGAASSGVDGYLTGANWTTFNGKEPALAAGTTAQYYRGDKSWQTLDKSAVGLGNVANTAQVTSVSGTASNISSTGGTTPVIDLVNAGTAGTYTKVTTDAKGRVTSGTTLIESDIPALSIAKTTGLQTAIDGKAPTAHASSATTYGVGSDVNYGHVKMFTSTGSSTDGTMDRNSITNALNGKQNSGSYPTTATGTANVLAKYTAAGAIGNSTITDNGSTITTALPIISGPDYYFSSGTLIDTSYKKICTITVGASNWVTHRIALQAAFFGNQYYADVDFTISMAGSSAGGGFTSSATGYLTNMDFGYKNIATDVYEIWAYKVSGNTWNYLRGKVMASTDIGGISWSQDAPTTSSPSYTSFPSLYRTPGLSYSADPLQAGLARLGPNTTYATWAQFSHKDKANATAAQGYGFMQSSVGTCQINSKGAISLEENGSVVATLTAADGVNLPLQTASRALVTDASKNMVSSATTATELGYVSGVTSAIQTQLNARCEKYSWNVTSNVSADAVGTYRIPLFKTTQVGYQSCQFLLNLSRSGTKENHQVLFTIQSDSAVAYSYSFKVLNEQNAPGDTIPTFLLHDFAVSLSGGYMCVSGAVLQSNTQYTVSICNLGSNYPPLQSTDTTATTYLIGEWCHPSALIATGTTGTIPTCYSVVLLSTTNAAAAWSLPLGSRLRRGSCVKISTIGNGVSCTISVQSGDSQYTGGTWTQARYDTKTYTLVSGGEGAVGIWVRDN